MNCSCGWALLEPRLPRKCSVERCVMKCGGFFPSPVVYCFSLTADLVIFLLHYWSAQLKEKLWSRAKPCLTAPVCHASMRCTHYSLFRSGSLCCANCVDAKHSTKTHLVYTRCDLKLIYCSLLVKYSSLCKENLFFTCYFVYALKKKKKKWVKRIIHSPF